MKLDEAYLASKDMKILSRLRQVRQTEDRGESEIQQMFEGATVFITGGTGFLGKQLIEKLLRSCRGIKKIYLLSRSKKGVDMEERLKTTLTDPVFDELRKIEPDFLKRLTTVEGDVMELRLGIKDEVWNQLAEETNFIIHEAATVRFDEPLKVATITNVRGTREVIRLAKDCKTLKSFVYVSTAYTTCNMPSASERFYPTPVTGEQLIDLAESVDSSVLDGMTQALLCNWPNTYTFSKAVAENMVKKLGEGLPVGIVRPAVVAPSYCEPTPGWLDISNCLGPSGIILASSIGLLKTINVDQEAWLPVVPVDFVNNLTIVTAWDTAKRFQSGDQEIRIHTMSNCRNKTNWKILRQHGEPVYLDNMSPKTIYYPGAIETRSKHIFLLCSIFFHFIPAFFIDIGLKIAGVKFSALRAYKKAYRQNSTLSYFLTKVFIFFDDNTLKLYQGLSENDKIIFAFDMAETKYNEYMANWWFGLRKYILKDELKGTEAAMKRLPYLRAIHYVVVVLYVFGLYKLFSLAFSLLAVGVQWVFTLGC